MLKNKKGVEMSLKAVVEILLASIIILSTIVLINMIFNAFSADDYSLGNFNSLGANTLSLIQSDEQFSTKIMPYHISKDYILVGFSSEWDDYKDINEVNNNKKVPRPLECAGFACLCIYEDEGRGFAHVGHGNDFDDDDDWPISCINLGTNIYISGADSYEQHFGNKRDDTPEDLALRQSRKEFIIQSAFFTYGGYNQPNILNPDNVVWEGIHNVEDYFPEENEQAPEVIQTNLDWFMSYLQKGRIEDKEDYEGGYDYDDGEPKDGVIDGYPYREIYNLYSFNNLFPLNHEYLILYGQGNGEKSGCNIVAPYDKKDNPIDDCADSQDYEEFGTRNLYIEKFVDEDSGKTHLLIAPYEGMIIGRDYSAKSVTSFLYGQAQTVLGNCPFPIGSDSYEKMETVSIDYEDIVTSQISSNSYSFEPELVYSIIFEYGNQEDYSTLNQYGLLRIHKADATDICEIPEADIETQLIDADTNIECGLKIIQDYYTQVEQNTNLDSNEIINNTLALFYSRDSSVLTLQDSEPAWKSDEESTTFEFVDAINEYTDCLLFSNTLINPFSSLSYPPVGGQCFPVAEDSINTGAWAMCGEGMNCDFGNCRGDCRERNNENSCTLRSRCHAGSDIWTKAPGHVLSIDDGEVIAVYYFYSCNDGWGGPGRVNAVIIDHGDYVVNYGEIDESQTYVNVGDTVTAGQVLGIASHCGMLHFELYESGVSANKPWPEDGSLVDAVCGGQWNYCLNTPELLAKKPTELLNPQETLENLQDNMCSAQS